MCRRGLPAGGTNRFTMMHRSTYRQAARVVVSLCAYAKMLSHNPHTHTEGEGRKRGEARLFRSQPGRQTVCAELVPHNEQKQKPFSALHSRCSIPGVGTCKKRRHHLLDAYAGASEKPCAAVQPESREVSSKTVIIMPQVYETVELPRCGCSLRDLSYPAPCHGNLSSRISSSLSWLLGSCDRQARQHDCVVLGK